MSSIVCPCGTRLMTGGFPEPGINKVISGEEYDAVTDPVDRTKLGVLFLRGRELLECPQCGRIFIRARGEREHTIYVREPTS